MFFAISFIPNVKVGTRPMFPVDAINQLLYGRMPSNFTRVVVMRTLTMGGAVRACASALKLLRSGAAASSWIMESFDGRLKRLPCLCSWPRHYRRKKLVDPYAYPTLYLGDEPKEASPESTPETPAAPKQIHVRNLKRKKRALQKIRFVNSERRKQIDIYKANLAARDAARKKHWKEAAARARQWREEAQAVLATKSKSAT